MSTDTDTVPTNARELVAYLSRHPAVYESCPDPRVTAEGALWFDRLADGGLWFRNAAGAERYLPVDCGMTAAETGLVFHGDGFVVTKFGVAISYRYRPDDANRDAGRGG